MTHPTFKTWLEGWEEYGFQKKDPEQDPTYSLGRPEPENPIDTFDVEYMNIMLQERAIGPLQASSHFVNEVTWGNHIGALRCDVNPGYGVRLERLGLDLKGQPRWYCKKYFQINRQGYGGYEEVVTQELLECLNEIHRTPNESAKREVEDFQGLVLRITERIKSVMRPIFMLDQIRKINDHRYIISLNVRGSGVQAPDQAQVFRNLTEVNFYADEGVIRIWNTSVESKVGRTKSPLVTPSHTDLIFFPTQSWDEIADPIATVLRFY